ncbi:MAG: hypothetical protein BSR46_12550 [Candidatus Dactylopiibacterium carminicum]|nr:cytochrome b/b6 domain-containing protein [Candidatus Dactylopiibacterium carminicum]PAS98239.1 MAG: hypothetical protein BSR46_12550 [Candidatus Dactylopiibacterium carminicum]
MQSSSSSENQKRILLWDLPLRLFHWALLLCVAGALLSINLADDWADGLDWHLRFGLAALSLLLFRLIWGFVGGSHARFGSFLPGPGRLFAFLRDARQRALPSVGHNPLGALSVIAMLASLSFQAISGLFISDGFMLEGPLYKHVSESTADWLIRAHLFNAWIIPVLIALHIAAIVFYRLFKKDDLLSPMITGRKTLPRQFETQLSRGGHWVLGLLVFLLCAVAVWLISRA